MSEQAHSTESAPTEDYPGLFVWNARCSGQATIGQSRLPLYGVLPGALLWGWGDAQSKYPHLGAGGPFADFLERLLEARGEFARLLCVLADVERQTEGITDWRDDSNAVNRVRTHLLCCLRDLNAPEPKP